MKNIISIKKLTFSYGDKKVFQDLTFSFDEGDFVSFVGPNGCGKSTIAKMIVGLIPSFDKITYNKRIVSNDNINEIRADIGIVFANPENSFTGESVIEDMAFTLENLGLSRSEMNERIEEVAKLLKIETLLHENPRYLSLGTQQKVALASVLVINPKVLIIDEGLSMIDEYEKDKIFKVLKKLNKNGMTIILISHDVKEIAQTKRFVGITKDGNVLKGKTNDLLKNEEMMKKLSIEQLFMVDLSLKLQLYELIDKVILDKKAMVKALWK